MSGSGISEPCRCCWPPSADWPRRPVGIEIPAPTRGRVEQMLVRLALAVVGGNEALRDAGSRHRREPGGGATGTAVAVTGEDLERQRPGGWEC